MVSEFEKGLESLFEVFSGIKSGQKRVMSLLRELSTRGPVPYSFMADFLMESGIPRSTAFNLARKIRGKLCTEVDDKLRLRKEVLSVLTSSESQPGFSSVSFPKYQIQRDSKLPPVSFQAVEWLSFIVHSTGYDLDNSIELLQAALAGVRKKEDTISEYDLVYEMAKVLRDKKYAADLADQLLEHYEMKVFHFHSKRTSIFDVERAVMAVTNELGEGSRKDVLNAVWKLKQLGTTTISPLALKFWVLTDLCNRDRTYAQLIKDLMWYGISKNEYDRIASSAWVLDEDRVIASKIRGLHVKISVLSKEEYSAHHDGDLWVHYLSSDFGVRPVLVSLDCFGIMNQGVFGHSGPGSVEVARSHLVQTVFTSPHLGSDIVFDYLNYALAKFANKSSMYLSDDFYDKNFIHDKMSQQIQGFLCEINHYMKSTHRFSSSINLSLVPPSTSKDLVDENQKEHAPHIAIKFLRLLEQGDAGRAFEYPKVYLKLTKESIRNKQLWEVLWNIYRQRGVTELYVVNMDFWYKTNKHSNVVFGNYRNSLTSENDEWMNETFNTGICGLVSLNLPRVALTGKAGRSEDDYLKETVKLAVNILDKNQRLIERKHRAVVSRETRSLPFLFEKARNCVGLVGLKEYLMFSGINARDYPKEAAEKALALVSKIKVILDDEVKAQDLRGRWELAQSYFPAKEFANRDRRRFGVSHETKLSGLERYTPGCSLFTYDVLTYENSSQLSSLVSRELALFELTKGGSGAMFNFKIGSAVRLNLSSFSDLMKTLVQQHTPIFNVTLLPTGRYA